MLAVLGGDVDPFVEDDAGHGSRHHVDAALVAEQPGLRSEHLADARAVDVSEGLNAAIHAEHPAKRHSKGGASLKRCQPAVAMQVNGDGRID